MGVFERITHKEEIEELYTKAQAMQESALEHLDKQKMETTKSLEILGELKLKAWANDMHSFMDGFGKFANTQIQSVDYRDHDFVAPDLTPSQLMMNIESASITANEVMKAGALSIGTGALVGIASYGGAMMFAKASTGTAISTLSGISKTNATLAWFGGGSIKSGGLGISGGKVVLAGIVLAPIVLVSGLIAAARGRARLAEAKNVYAQAQDDVAKIDLIVIGLEGIERISECYIDLLQGLSQKLHTFISEMKKIAKDYTAGEDGKIDYNQLSEMERKTLHLSWLLVQLYYHSLSMPILTEDGKVDPKADSMLTYTQKEYRQLSLDVTEFADEKQKISEALASSRTSFKTATQNLEELRSKSREVHRKYTKEILIYWTKYVAPFVEQLSKFENVDIENILVSELFNLEMDLVFEKIFEVSDIIKEKMKEGIFNSDHIAMINVSLRGIDSLYLTDIDNMSQAPLTSKYNDTSVWLYQGFSQNMELEVGEVLSASVYRGIEQTINGITGKENLNTAEYIKKEVLKLVKNIDAVIEKINKASSLVLERDESLKKIVKVLELYTKDVKKIYSSNGGSEQIIYFENLKVEEQRVIQMACNLVKLFYVVANTQILRQKEDLNNKMFLEEVLKDAKKELHLLKKKTYRMIGNDLRVANVFWAPRATKMFIMNSVFILLFVLVSVYQLPYGSWYGTAGILGVVVAFPKFFYFKGLSESQLWFWRWLRLILAIVIFISVEVIGLVV